MEIIKICLSVTALILMCSCGNKNNPENDVKPTEVKVVTMQETFTDQNAAYSGTVEEMSGAMLSFAQGGTIQSLNVCEGQTVRRGQLIATVDTRPLRNEYNIVVSSLAQAKDAYSRMKILHREGSIPEMQWIEVISKLKQAQAQECIARKNLNDAALCAPFSGYISVKQAEAGENVGPGMPVVKLVKIDNVKVKISVPENEIEQFKKGQNVIISVDALGGEHFIGHIEYKGVESNQISHSYDVMSIVNNPNHRLLPGMICSIVKQENSVARRMILSPKVVQIDSDNKPFVWTDVNGKAHKVYISIGDNVGNMVIVKNGLIPGDKVIVEGQQKVSESTRLKIKDAM